MLLLLLLMFSNRIQSIKENGVGIVYYTYLNPSRWRYLIPGQLGDLIHSGIFEHYNSQVILYVVLSLTESKYGEYSHAIELQQAERTVYGLMRNYSKQINITLSDQNLFEYSGIKMLHQLAVENPNNLYFYHHGKGMVYRGGKTRIAEDIILFKTMVKSWKAILEIFDKKDEVNKVAFGCSEESYTWYNFFWIRGSLLSKFSAPLSIATSSNPFKDRGYYERYIGIETQKYLSANGLKEAPYKDCFSQCHSFVNKSANYYQRMEINENDVFYKMENVVIAMDNLIVDNGLDFFENGQIFQGREDPHRVVYLFEDGKKRPFLSMKALTDHGYNLERDLHHESNIFRFNHYPVGDAINT